MKYMFFVLLLSVSSFSFGQFVEPKLGKVEMADMTMPKYELDSSASAVFLFDNGETKFILSPDLDFQFIYVRHCQIKILDKSAFPLGDVKIRLYSSGQRSEKLGDLKAFTYNLADGKIVKTKLDNDKIYRSKADNYTVVNFAFPDVKEGSVLELSYSITSDFLYNFRGWTFQGNYPARWSQYRYEIPEYYQYRQSSKGYLPFFVNKREEGSTTFNIKVEAEAGAGYGTRPAPTMQTLKAITEKGVFAVRDVPAFISEPNIDCEDNYVQSIEFELSSVKFPNSVRKDYTKTWESVNKEMLEDEDFGQLMKSNGFVKDTVTAMCSKLATEIDKAAMIYNYLQARMKWDGTYRVWATDGLKKPFTERVGSSAELNLLLTLMLQTAGLNANPVMFSTRDNGIASSVFPTITKFNSVLSSLTVGDKVYLLDVTSKNCPFGVLPANDINGNGRIVNAVGGGWVSLDPVEKSRVVAMYSLNIDPEGKFSGLVTESSAGYAAISLRNRMNSEKSAADFFRKMQENTKGLTINRFTVADADNIYKPVSDSLFVDITDNAELIGDKIMFKPLLFEVMEKNSYTLEERKYPVNYNYPISEQYLFTYTIPEGYSVESLPASSVIKLPDNSISASYNVQVLGNKITVAYRFNINKILFLPEEYSNVRSLYDQLVKKHSEQVILKKGA
jgi:hypothetical protein